MPTVRELSTKFSFDVDTQGVQKFNRILGGMKKQVLAVGAALGVGLGARALFNFGVNLERARFQAGRFSDIIRDTGKFAAPLQKRLEDLNKLFRDGAFTQAQAFDAFFAFSNAVEGFPTLKDKFGDFFEFAVLLNKAGQRNNLGERIQQVVDALKTGDVSFLKELPGFSDIAGAKIEKLQEILRGAFFLPVGQRAESGRRITAAMASLVQGLRDTAIAADKTDVGKLNTAMTRLEQVAQRLGKSILKFITPAIEGLTELLNIIEGKGRDFPVLEKLGRFLGLIPGDAKKGKEAIDALFDSLKRLGFAAAAGVVAGLVVGLPPIVGAAIGIAGGIALLNLKEAAKQFFTPSAEDLKGVPKPGVPFGPAVEAEQNFQRRRQQLQGIGPTGSLGGANIQVFITGSNPLEIGRMVVEKLNEAVARASVPFTAIEGLEPPT